MKGQRFPLFHSPIDLAHHFWHLLLKNGDGAIDATCGNGHDTLFLAQICDRVLSIDIQPKALQNAKKRLEEHGLDHVTFLLQSHETFPPTDFPIKLIVYNLGYLPGGDKERTTLVATTLKSVQEALGRIEEGGMVSITSYPGHLEGQREQQALLTFCGSLDPKIFNVCHTSWTNRNKGPSLFLIQKTER